MPERKFSLNGHWFIIMVFLIATLASYFAEYIKKYVARLSGLICNFSNFIQLIIGGLVTMKCLQ